MGIDFVTICDHGTTHQQRHKNCMECSEGLVVAKSMLVQATEGDWCPSCGKVHTKSPGDPRWAINRPPHGMQVVMLRGGIIQNFRLQHQAILNYYGLVLVPPPHEKTLESARTKSIWTKPPFDFSKFTRAEAARLLPALEMHYEEGAQRVLSRVGATAGEAWSVHAPKVRTALRKHAIRLCADTAATTSLQLNDAIRKIKQDIAAELLNEETSRRALVDVVGKIFQGAERWRASRIAVTEASMALHDGEILAGAESGVVLGYEPLVSADACEICQSFAQAFDYVPMDEALAGIGQYASATGGRNLPPYHANCECSVTERLDF